MEIQLIMLIIMQLLQQLMKYQNMIVHTNPPMIRWLIILLLIVGCGTEPEEARGICVEREVVMLAIPATFYDCWDNKTEDSCYGDFHIDTTCSEFCEDKLFCDMI